MKLFKQFLVFLKANKYSVTNIMIILLNPWWWVIIQSDLWIGVIAFILSIVFVHYVVTSSSYSFYNKSKITLLLLLGLTSLLIIIILRQGFDESIFKLSPKEIQQQNKRHEFYAHNLGKIYTNKFSLSYYKNYSYSLLKFERNFFANLDPNLYFFASHPRERAGIDEFEKYTLIFVPFFIIGFIYSIYYPRIKTIAYIFFVLILSSLISPSYKFGPILSFPVINFMITIGFLVSLKFVLKYIKNV